MSGLAYGDDGLAPRFGTCDACCRTLDVFGNSGGRYERAYSEDVRDGQPVYYCRDCTLEAYAFCETVWVTHPPRRTDSEETLKLTA